MVDVTGTKICVPKCTDTDMGSKTHSSQKYVFQNTQYEINFFFAQTRLLDN